jgi:hypothetical protein
MKSNLYKLVRLSDGLIVEEGAKRTIRKKACVPGHKMMIGSPWSIKGQFIAGDDLRRLRQNTPYA